MMIDQFANDSNEYKLWLSEVKTKIRTAQVKIALAANGGLIQTYWELGQMINEKQLKHKWGDKLIDQVAKDLKEEFPDNTGFSTSNLKYCKRFYSFYQTEIGQQPVDQFEDIPLVRIPWGHNILIFTKSKNITEARFYIQQTLENNWSRDVLALQIKTNLYDRSGKAISNFTHTLPDPMSDLAQQTLKDPYVFDFVSLTKPFKEKDIENQLVHQITKFFKKVQNTSGKSERIGAGFTSQSEAGCELR
ncbi:Predicted nuclease of restriction endonuclease-like (RecB) superfamily, DUF1016 family [bacterium A37T11]|nr:Predicted nuclease of restriction endonuclease-like (RecB) superfamily, DUF1016 family [bacterium A37T11]